jgi:hypothetical protein
MNIFLQEFRETIDDATQRLSSISEAQSRIQPGEGQWSPKEIIGHLIDSAANNHSRFVRAQYTDHLEFPGYDGDQWVAAQQYIDEPWQQLINLWQLYNLHLVHLMSHASEENRMKSRSKHNLDQIAFKTVSTDQPVTLDYFMRDYVDHLRHHLDQIFEK